MTLKRLSQLIGIAVMTVLLASLTGWAVWTLPLFNPLKLKLLGKKTVAERVAEYGPAARERLRPNFERAGVVYPPSDVQLLFVKSQKVLHVFAANPEEKQKLIKSYPVLGASGKPGPKLKAGDRQVPEGIYRVEALNPNSAFHLSLRLNYPNPDDLRFAAQDQRRELGSDIMIHGRSASIGCVAIGDEAIEELFTLAAESGFQQWKVILSPVDFRTNDAPPDLPLTWLPELYSRVKAEMQELPRE